MGLVRCPEHGITYDDEQHSSCGLCRRELTDAERRKKLWIGAGIATPLLIGFGLFVWLRWLPQTLERMSQQQQEDVRESEDFMPRLHLDPEKYRPQIEAIEAVLYRQGPAEPMDADRVEAAVSDLASAIVAREKGILINTGVTSLAAFGGTAGASAETGFANLDLASTRERWEKIRERAFQPADWFAKAPPPLAEGKNPAPPELPPQEIGPEYQDAVEKMEALVTAAAEEAGEFGEIGVDVAEESARARALVERWNAWSREWDTRLREAAASFPPSPSMQGSPQLFSAHQDLRNAYQELSLLPSAANDYGVPFRSERENRIQGAWAALQGARTSLGLPAAGEAPSLGKSGSEAEEEPAEASSDEETEEIEEP